MKEKVFKFFLSKRIVIFLLIANVTFLAQGAKYYAYQTGDWSSVATWTLDASGTTHIGSTIPGDNDEVFILSNKKVTLSADVSTEGLKISINAGGILDLATYKFTNSLETLKGVGTLQLASTDFPTIVGDDSFIKSGGGTTEYLNSSDFTFIQSEYNNLTISINSLATATQLDNLQINGKLHIKSGIYQISDDNTSKEPDDLRRYELAVGDDVEVDAGATIKVGTRRTTLTEKPTSIANIDENPYVAYYKNHSHIVRIGGSLTNNGTVRFTNMPYPIYNKFPKANNETGFATVYFQGTTHNTITANGTTDFYNLVVDKGNNQSYKLTLYSSHYHNFRLFGANTEGGINNGEANPIIRKALWLRNGTFELTGQVVIPSLTEGGGEPAGKANFIIPQNAALVLNGPDVIVMVTADDYRELNVAYGVSTTSNTVAGIKNTAVDAGILVHGKLQVIDGYLSTRESSGILYPKNACVGEVVINGGKVEAKQFAPFDESEGLVSYTQTGGVFELRGRFKRKNGDHKNYITPQDLVLFGEDNVYYYLPTAFDSGITKENLAVFTLISQSNVFNMSDGNLNLHACSAAASGSPTNGLAVLINTTPSNSNVTGGTVRVAQNGGIVHINSDAPFFNMELDKSSSSNNFMLGHPLTVVNNLEILAGKLDTQGHNVTVGGDFFISGSGSYIHNENTLTFNGSGNQIFTISNHIYNINIDKSGGELSIIKKSSPLYIRGNLNILKGTVSSDSLDLRVNKNVINSGYHKGTGIIVMYPEEFPSSKDPQPPQTIGGDGTGVFTNLRLQNSTGVTLTANTTFLGLLNFHNKQVPLDIDKYNIKFGPVANIKIDGSTSKDFFKSNGNFGDGGVTYTYTNESAKTFSVAVGERRTTVEIGFTEPLDSYGSITVIPVENKHPLTNSSNVLTFFWKIRSSGFSGYEGKVNHKLIYHKDYYVDDGAKYVPAIFHNNEWFEGVEKDRTSTTINFNVSKNISSHYLDGDYTAGKIGSFSDPQVFYSTKNGDWDDVNTWVMDDQNGDIATTLPTKSDVVIIENNHQITLSNSAYSAILQINENAILDVKNYFNSDLGMVMSNGNGNNGKIRVRPLMSDYSFKLPKGDYSEFNRDLGTIEFYMSTTNDVSYYLPSDIDEYGNLNINLSQNASLIFGNTDLLVLGNLTLTGVNSQSKLLLTPENDYPDDVEKIAKTIIINGDFDLQSGALIYENSGELAQNIDIKGDFKIAENAGVRVKDDALNQEIRIKGNLINNALKYSSDESDDDSYRGGNFKNINVVFYGEEDSYITNTENNDIYTHFDNLTIDKGITQKSKLIVDVAGSFSTPNNSWLDIKNGTFVYKRDTDDDLILGANKNFVLGSTAGIWIENSGNGKFFLSEKDNNNKDFFLGGKLTIISGDVYVGEPLGSDFDNDIEYTATSQSTIEIHGGRLTVNGKIRRAESSEGVLKYIQTGGEVLIRGNTSDANRNKNNAKLEILNPGSVFNMSGGTLTIGRSDGGMDYGDLFLHPSSSSITGGTIIFDSFNAESYLIDSNVALNNLSINAGDVKVKTNPLTIKGNLTIATGASLDMNESFNIPLILKGNFVNDGTYIPRSNTTTFSGGAQTVSGISETSFYNLKVNPTTSVTLDNNVEVLNDLELLSGNFVIGNKTVLLKRHLINNAAYQTLANSGGIVLTNGDVQHSISGTGTFDRLEIDDVIGARLVSDIYMRRSLTLTDGILNINKYLLNLGQNAEIMGSDFGADKMIITDGVYSNSGIQKLFPQITEQRTFIYPLGVLGKYTPANLTIDLNASVGQIRIIPVNEKHPSTLSPYQVLDYYWDVESTGITELDGQIDFSYCESDVLQNIGDDNEYIAARLLVPGISWQKVLDQVDVTQNIVTFIFSKSDNLGGHYTAGLDANIPDEIATYTTISSGNWSKEDIWSPTAPTGGPTGSVVIIDSEHDVVLDRDHIFAYKTTILGKLKVDKSYYGHNLGAIDGDGILYIEKDVLPAGRYDNFLIPEGNSTIELSGDEDYNILTELFSEIPNLIISGTGKRILPYEDFVIHKSLIIDGGTLDNSLNNRTLIVNGTMELINGGTFIPGTGTNAIVKFNGSSMQELGGFVGTNAFQNLEINNSNGLTLTDDVEIKGQLKLTKGVIYTSNDALLKVTNSSPTDAVLPSGGSATSYVDGPMVKKINNGDSFRFPIGIGGKLMNLLEIYGTQGGIADWKVEYTSPNSTSESYNTPLTFVNSKDKWKVSAPVSSKAYMKISWNSNSEVNPSFTTNGTNDLKLGSYNTATNQWNLIEATAVGNNSSGIITSNERVTIPVSGNIDVTSAIISSIDARAKFVANAVGCGPTAGIPMTFISSSPIATPYQITYSIDGVTQPEVTINKLPYTLPTTIAGDYQLLGFKHTVGMIGNVDNTVVTLYDNPTTANAGDDQSLCGLDETVLEANIPLVGDGMWSIIEGNGGSIADPTQHNSEFYGVNGNGYTLRWTTTNGNCESYDDVKITFPLVAKQPDNFVVYNTQVCSGSSNVTYTVPYDATVSYIWSYTGTGVTITGSSNSVKLSFDIDATAGDLSVIARNNCDESAPRTISITVNHVDNVILTSDLSDDICASSLITFEAVPDAGTWGSFNFLVDGVPVQNSQSPTFASTGLFNGNKVKVIATSTNGCTVTTNEIEVVLSSAEGVWTGLVDNEWDNPGNWCNGIVPNPSDDIIIDKNSGELILKDNHILGGLTVKEHGTVSIMPGATVDIVGALSIEEDGKFIINNNYEEDGLASLRTFGTVTGDATVKLTLPTKEWYYLASPMYAPTTSQFGVGKEGTYAYTYSTAKAWVQQTIDKGIANGEGMSVYYLVDNEEDKVTLDYSGVLNTGTVSTEYKSKNFYLFGNPFPVSLNWQDESWERNRIAGTIWYRTRIGSEMGFVTYNRYGDEGTRVALYPEKPYNGDYTEAELGLIPPYQSVWVYTRTATSSTPASITITDVQKVHRAEGATGATLKSSSSGKKSDIIRIVSKNDRSRDGAVIYFSENSTDALDQGDSEKYFNSSTAIPEVYTRIGKDAVAINGLAPFEGSREIPLSVRNREEGEVELKFDLSLYRSDDVIVLQDFYMDEKVNLRAQSTYKYEPLSLGDEHKRFSILINPEDYDGSDEVITNIEDAIYSGISIQQIDDKALITVSQALLNNNKANIFINDIEGRRIAEYVSTTEHKHINLPDAKGVYIITVIVGNKRESKMIVKTGHDLSPLW